MAESVSAGRSRTFGSRLRVAVALLAAAGGLAACNANSDTTTQVVTSSAGCQGGRIIGVGASLDLSGPSAAVGRAYLTGLELGIQKVNSGGGVPGHNSCLELLYKNNQGSAAIDAAALSNLVYAEGALAIVSSYVGPSTVGGSSYLHALGVPVTSFSTLPATFDPKLYKDTFPMTTAITVQSQVMAKFATAHDLSKVALIVTSDATSRQGAAEFAQSASAAGLTVTGRATVSASGAGAASALSGLRAGHPKAVVVIDDGGATAAILAARNKLGWTVPVIAGPPATEAPAIEAAGAGGLKNVWAVVPSAIVTSSTASIGAARSFRNEVLSKLGVSHLTGSVIPYAQAYDGVTMFGSAATGTMDTLVSDIKTFLENANFQGVLASYTYTTGHHVGIPESELSVVPVSTLSNGLFNYTPPKKAKEKHAS